MTTVLPCPVEVLEDAHELVGELLVEVGGRLVGDDDLGLIDQRPRDGHPLLLAAGQLAHPPRRLALHPERLERRLGPPPHLGRPHVDRVERQHDVVEDGQVRDQVELLEDEAELLAAALW